MRTVSTLQFGKVAFSLSGIEAVIRTRWEKNGKNKDELSPPLPWPNSSQEEEERMWSLPGNKAHWAAARALPRTQNQARSLFPLTTETH